MHHSLYVLYSLGTRYPISTTCLLCIHCCCSFFPRFHTTTSIDLCIFSLWTIITIHHTRHTHILATDVMIILSLSLALYLSRFLFLFPLILPIHNPFIHFPYPLPRHAHSTHTPTRRHTFFWMMFWKPSTANAIILMMNVSIHRDYSREILTIESESECASAKRERVCVCMYIEFHDPGHCCCTYIFCFTELGWQKISLFCTWFYFSLFGKR